MNTIRPQAYARVYRRAHACSESVYACDTHDTCCVAFVGNFYHTFLTKHGTKVHMIPLLIAL